MENKEFTPVLMVGVILGFVIGTVIATAFSINAYQTRIVERGYGLYCPNNGVFAFKGECKE